MQAITTQVLQNELWWGGLSSPASEQAYDKDTVATLRPKDFQSAPFYLSSQGRYIWSNSPIEIEFNKGTITATGKNVQLVQAGTTLKEAYLAAMKAHFPFENKELPEKFFRTACKRYAFQREEKGDLLVYKLRLFYQYYDELRDLSCVMDAGELLTKILLDTRMEARLLSREKRLVCYNTIMK